jgi:hypothetical protein
MPESIGIAYGGGAYGVYMQWLLYTLLYSKKIESPFTASGTSHNFNNSVSSDIRESYARGLSLDQIEATASMPKIFRCHPKNSTHCDLVENMNLLLDRSERVILLYPDRGSYLLNVNNYMYKVWGNIWEGLSNLANVNNLYNNFNVSATTTLESVPQDIVREFISHDVFPSWENQVEWFFPDTFAHLRCHVVYINDLLYNPQQTVDDLEKFLNVKWIRPFSDLESFHSLNLSLQKYLHQDRISNDIISALDTRSLLTWQPCDLTLVTEAWLQMQIRNRGWDLQCTEMINFPTSTQELMQRIVF